MNVSKMKFPQRAIATAVVFALVAPFAHAATEPLNAGAGGQQQSQEAAQSQQQNDQQQPAQTQQPADAQQQNDQQQPAQTQQPMQPQVVPGLETRAPDAPAPAEQVQNPDARPVGAAAAPLTRPTGIAASRPAGAAIAPAKQRRAKAIVIRVAIIVGAAVAIGAVAGLSKSSSSRP